MSMVMDKTWLILAFYRNEHGNVHIQGIIVLRKNLFSCASTCSYPSDQIELTQVVNSTTSPSRTFLFLNKHISFLDKTL